MDLTSKLEPNPSDSMWFSSLQLLGYAESDFFVVISPNSFDYPNPVAFQHAFYFLFNLLDQEKSKSEFRDCWPILEKKQEAEFRRKVATLVKGCQKTYPRDLPYTNPSLFQSPGGRKFIVFLNNFSNLVLQLQVGDMLLSKSVTKNGKLKKVCYKNFVKQTKIALVNASNDQAAFKDIEVKSRETIESIGQKYFDIKKSVEETDKKGCHDLHTLHSFTILENGSVDKEGLLKSYDEKCIEVKKIFNGFKEGCAKEENLWDSIKEVVDDSLSKPNLDFSDFPKELVCVDSFNLTYGNLISKFLFSVDRVLLFKHQPLPFREMSRVAGIYTSQAQQLSELQTDLSTTWGRMTENLRRMLAISTQIDWPNSELAIHPKRSHGGTNSEAPSPVLLPPTPSMLEDIRKLKTENSQHRGITSNLQLLSPTPQTPHPSGNVSAHIGSSLTQTPISTGQVTRRFPRRINTDQSPLLKQSLIQSTLQRAGEGFEDYHQTQEFDEVTAEENEKESSKASLNIFSPVLNFTKSPEETYSRPSVIVDSIAASSVSSASAGLSSTVSKEDFSLGSRPGSSLRLFDDSRPSSHGSFGSRPSSSLGFGGGSSNRGVFGLDPRPSTALGLNVGNGPSPTFGSLRAAADASVSEDNTQSKLEMYRKIIESTKNKTLTGDKPRSTLQSVWNSHRQSLSPQFKPKSDLTNDSQGSPPRHLSPLMNYRTPDMFQGMDSKKMGTRLEQLMTTLTFSDDSLDLSLGRMSLGGEEFLSPHCP